MKTELKKRMLECINRACSTSLETLEPETNLRNGLELDSLAIVMLQVEVEEEFRFTFNPIEDDFEKIFQTFGSLCDYVESRGEI